MQHESGGRTIRNGQPITSSAGAMGLMQLMPKTYAEMRRRYGLGPDPYDPHDNVFGGTAYLREMFERYGYPNLFAAYNAGPRRLDDFLLRHRPLPQATIDYANSIVPGSFSGAGSAVAERNLTLQTVQSPSARMLFFAIGSVRGKANRRPASTANLVTPARTNGDLLFVPLSSRAP